MALSFEDRVIASEAQISLFNQFSHALDYREWNLLTELFAEDGEFSTIVEPCFELRQSGQQGEVLVNAKGRHQVVSIISSFIESVQSTHHMMSNHVIDIGSDGRSARASANARAYHVGKGEKSNLFEQSLARFEIDSVYDSGRWRIRRMREVIVIMLGTIDTFL